MNPYTSLWTGVTPGDGPQQWHLVLLDNGRTDVLADAVGRQTLNCIRCSACLNVCPVYERVGGHAYSSVYPGPIGAILTPQLVGVKEAGTLPYASTLCGACYEVCPVKINIPEVLVHMRGKAVDAKRGTPTAEQLSMQAMAWVFGDPGRLGLAEKAAALGARPFGRSPHLPGALGAWTSARDLPPVPKESFRAWWKRTRGASSPPAAALPPAASPPADPAPPPLPSGSAA
jgi:L-lactate dehydrogenase complex protein LldF